MSSIQSKEKVTRYAGPFADMGRQEARQRKQKRAQDKKNCVKRKNRGRGKSYVECDDKVIAYLSAMFGSEVERELGKLIEDEFKQFITKYVFPQMVKEIQMLPDLDTMSGLALIENIEPIMHRYGYQKTRSWTVA